MVKKCALPLTALTLLFVILQAGWSFCHEAKDFDDSILYKIDFEIPDFEGNPELRNHLRTFHTHEKEQYDCVIPVVEAAKEEKATNAAEPSPYALLQPLFTSPSCSYRIEAYWTYEICHGQHVRQYHEEREGKTVKFQEYKLGQWSAKNREEKLWEKSHFGFKYKTTKIDNTKYLYFEVEMTDGTICDIIDAPRTTFVRYVCYSHGKNEIYSFKETSSCNYEAIILTSALCMIPSFHPEESKEVSIKCFNSATEPHKPLSMLRQELSELQYVVYEINESEHEEASAAVAALASDIDKMIGMIDTSSETGADLLARASVATPAAEISPIREFISGKDCLTGGTGWWKYEFCYGRHVRQFHKDKKSETELYLGFFSEDAHRHWLSQNPDKSTKRGQGAYSASLWHHYEKGTRCDRTGLPREVDVKLTCVPFSSSATAVSMYLLEPKTCQYILVVESHIICDLQHVADEHGVVQEDRLHLLLQQQVSPLRRADPGTAGTPQLPSADVPEEPTSSASESTDDQKGVVGPTGERASSVDDAEPSEHLNT